VFGYIPDIGVPPPPEPMDFAAWFEVYLDGRWHTFDARNNTPRIGRVVVGRGRDAIDVALITSFGPLTLTDFEVRAERPRRVHGGTRVELPGPALNAAMERTDT
jgi:transglutaminase-like putative cysteine protease